MKNYSNMRNNDSNIQGGTATIYLTLYHNFDNFKFSIKRDSISSLNVNIEADVVIDHHDCVMIILLINPVFFEHCIKLHVTLIQSAICL